MSTNNVDNWSLIARAIRQKRQVIAKYNGRHRELCPHALGIKRGKQHCIFYQFAGTSSSAPIRPNSQDNWRCMNLAKLKIIDVREGPWHTQTNFRTEPGIDEIVVQVEPSA